MGAKDDFAALVERLDYPGSGRLRRILELLMNRQQARLAAALPGTAAEVAQKTGVPLDVVRQELDRLYFKGVVFPRDFDNREFFRFARSVGQLHDSTEASKELDMVKDRPLFEAWRDFVNVEMLPRMGKARAVQPRPHLRIVPAYMSIKDMAGILPCEDVRELLKAQQLIAAVPCSCRYRSSSVGEQCDTAAETERWNCIQFNRGAEYAIKRGTGKQLSLEEAVDLAGAVEEDGLLHTWANNASLNEHRLMCNCCRDCCITYRSSDLAGSYIGKSWEKSRYQAEIDVDACNGCGVCVERCKFDAIEMKREGAVLDAEKCFGCGVCVVGCAPQAIRMKAVRPPQHIPGAMDQSLI